MTSSDMQTLCDHVTSLQTPPADHVFQSADEFAELIADDESRFVLFPEGYIHTLYCVYEASPQAAYDIWKPDIIKMAVSKSKNGQATTLSILTSYPSVCGISVQMDMYGYVDVDVSMAHMKLFLPQIQTSLAKAGGTLCLGVAFHVLYPMEPHIELYRRTLKFSDGRSGVIKAMGLKCDKPAVQV